MACIGLDPGSDWVMGVPIREKDSRNLGGAIYSHVPG